MSRFRQLMIANRRNKYPANATVWQLTIPEGGATYSFDSLGWNSATTIDWGDGTVENMTARNPVHTYAAGVYTVVYTGKYDTLTATLGNKTYGQYVTGVTQLSRSCTSYSGFLNASSVKSIPRNLLFDGILIVSSFLKNNKTVAALPDGFSLPATVQNCAEMFSVSALTSLPDSFVLPRSVTNLSSMFWAMSNIKFDIGHFLQNIATSGSINIEAAFGACMGITGTAPADKLWGNPNVSWRSTNAFMRCEALDNYAEIPPTWGGGKVILDDMTIDSGTAVDVEIAKVNVNYGGHGNYYGTKFTSTNMPAGLSFTFDFSTSPNSCKIKGTLPAGTYTFDVTLSNKWSSDTATITLIVGGGGSSSGGGLKVSGVMATMAAMLTPAFSFADGNYSLLDASATGNSRVWKLENGGTAFYFRWSETELAWTLAETEEDPAMNGFPYIYSTVNGSDPWSSSGWEFSLTGPVSIEVTQA